MNILILNKFILYNSVIGTGSVSSTPVLTGELFTISGDTDLGPIREYKGRIKLSYKTTTNILHIMNITCSGVKAGS